MSDPSYDGDELRSPDPEVSKVNKSVGKGLASAIEKGEKATEVTKDNLGEYMHTLAGVGITADEAIQGMAKDKATEASRVAGQKANQVRSSLISVAPGADYTNRPLLERVKERGTSSTMFRRRPGNELVNRLTGNQSLPL